MFEINCDYFPGFGEGTIICISNDNLHSQLIYTSSPWMAANTGLKLQIVALFGSPWIRMLS